MSHLTTENGIKEFLVSKDRPFATVKELSGGGANYTFRVTSKDGKTFVLKHAEAYVKFNHDLLLKAERMNYEANAIATIGSLLAELKNEILIGPPDLLEYYTDEHVLLMSDGRGDNLKVLYPQLSTEQVRSAGQRLGKWLAALHATTTREDTSIGEGGNPIARAIYQYSYQNLAGALASFGLGGEEGRLGTRVQERYGTLMSTDDVCVCHGDFWTGNMIVNMDDPTAKDLQLTLVDWELCRRGVPATDAAQFVAEAYLSDRFSPSSHGLASTFLESYTANAKPSEAFWERFLVHWSVHVIFWPTHVTWGSKDEMKKIAVFAANIIERVMNGTPDSLLEVMKDFKIELDRNS